MSEKVVIKKQQCSECLSGQTYVRISTNERVCRLCGHVEKLEVKNE